MLSNKNATEMFEKIGYKSISDDKFISWIFKCDEYTKEIAFDFNTERVEFYFYDNEHKEMGISLTLEETLATYKQADELWGHKEDKQDSLKELKDLNSDWGFESCDIHIEELRLDMQTVKHWISDIVKVINNANR